MRSAGPQSPAELLSRAGGQRYSSGQEPSSSLCSLLSSYWLIYCKKQISVLLSCSAELKQQMREQNGSPVPLGGEVVQAGSDVMSVIVHLFTVEAALHLQTVESLTELQELSPPALTMQTLLTDVLGSGGKVNLRSTTSSTTLQQRKSSGTTSTP